MSNKSEATFHGRVQTGLPDAAENLAPVPLEPSTAAQRDVEAETVGDWAGHTPVAGALQIPRQTPTIDAEISAGQEQLDLDADLAAYQRQNITDGIRDLVMISGENSRDHGFHDDWPVDIDLVSPETDRDFQKAIIEKLDLIHEELSEALGEIRSGHGVEKIYFSQTTKRKDDDGNVIAEIVYYHDEQEYRTDGTPLYKPEGFLVELADAEIRLADLVFLVRQRERYVKALELKHEYNRSRPYKHGRQL